MKSDMWTYSDEYSSQTMDVEGFEVAATDGDIGKVDEATYDVGTSYIVVDTGPWIFGRKVLLPAGVIERIDLDNREGRGSAHEGTDQELARVRRGHRGLSFGRIS